MTPVPDLVYRAGLGRLAEVSRAYAERPDAGVADAGGYTAVHAAAENGHADVPRFLSERNADPNPLAGGRTPYELAVAADRRSCVSLLLDRGGHAGR